MRKNVFIQTLVLSMVLWVGVSCSSRVLVRYPTAKGLPPGQAKKVYGHQSARAFAPGQQKKKYPAFKSQQDGKAHKKGKKKK